MEKFGKQIEHVVHNHLRRRVITCCPAADDSKRIVPGTAPSVRGRCVTRHSNKKSVGSDSCRNSCEGATTFGAKQS